MKTMILMLFVMLASSYSFAEEVKPCSGDECEAVSSQPVLESVTCTKDTYRLEITFGSIGGKGTGSVRLPFYTLFENDQIVSPVLNGITLVDEGYEDTLLNAYVWMFESEGAIVGVGLPGPKDIVPGTYTEAKADLFVTVGNHTMDGSTVDCIVTIK